jgi:hypothetical protein
MYPRLAKAAMSPTVTVVFPTPDEVPDITNTAGPVPPFVLFILVGLRIDAEAEFGISLVSLLISASAPMDSQEEVILAALLLVVVTVQVSTSVERAH